MQIDAQKVKRLRDKTGAGIMDCKEALKEAGGDEDKAVTILREKDLATAEKKSSRSAKEGLIEAYIHPGGKVGVLIEVNCETDFVARNDEFKSFVRDICLQIAAMNPAYLSRVDVPESKIEAEKEIIRRQALNEGKPEKVVEKIIEGRIKKYFSENCLLEQPFVKDDSMTINDLLVEKIAKIGENIVIKRFAYFRVGETLPSESED